MRNIAGRCTGPRSKLRWALLAFGLVNAVLYAGLQPLWEGFDESFHYGYVQELSRQHRSPVLGRTCLSLEIWQSMGLVPVGHTVRLNVQRGIAIADYWRLTGEERGSLRRELERIDPREGGQPSHTPNYEAQQAPLAYVPLALLDAAGWRMPLLVRVLGLRLWCAVLAAILTALATLRLTRLLGLPEAFRLSTLFLVFSSQMFYATTAHVSNDWLAMPLFTFLLAQCVAVHLRPTGRRLVWLGLAWGAALLAKAYFLALAPLVLGVVLAGVLGRRVPRRQALGFLALSLGIAALWYLRNLVVYGELSGMQETVGGTPLAGLVAAALRLPWLKSLWTTAHMSLWTGNSSLTAFHSGTVTTMILALLAAAGLYLGDAIRRRPGAAEVVVSAGLLSFAAALAYDSVLTFWYTHGLGFGPSPSYVQLLSPPLLALLLLGLSRTGWAGRAVHLAILWLWAYAIAATYVAKLVPFYAGLTADRARLADLPGWYARLIAGGGGLDTTALLPTAVLLTLTGAVVAGAVGWAAWLSLRVARPEPQFLVATPAVSSDTEV